jgi:hypothetical protein
MHRQVDAAEEELKKIHDAGARNIKLLGKDIKKQKLFIEKLRLHKIKVKNEHSKLQKESNNYVDKNNAKERGLLEITNELDMIKKDKINVMDDLEVIQNHIIKT